MHSAPYGDDLKLLYPVVEKDMSDSGSVDNVLEFLCQAGGRTLPEVSVHKPCSGYCQCPVSLVGGDIWRCGLFTQSGYITLSVWCRLFSYSGMSQCLCSVDVRVVYVFTLYHNVCVVQVCGLFMYSGYITMSVVWVCGLFTCSGYIKMSVQHGVKIVYIFRLYCNIIQYGCMGCLRIQVISECVQCWCVGCLSIQVISQCLCSVGCLRIQVISQYLYGVSCIRIHVISQYHTIWVWVVYIFTLYHNVCSVGVWVVHIFRLYHNICVMWVCGLFTCSGYITISGLIQNIWVTSRYLIFEICLFYALILCEKVISRNLAGHLSYSLSKYVYLIQFNSFILTLCKVYLQQTEVIQ